jgi:hypothetical protein
MVVQTYNPSTQELSSRPAWTSSKPKKQRKPGKKSFQSATRKSHSRTIYKKEHKIKTFSGTFKEIF